MKTAIAWHSLPHRLHHSHVKYRSRVSVICPRASWLSRAITMVTKRPQLDSFVFTRRQEAVLTILYIHWTDWSTVAWQKRNFISRKGAAVRLVKLHMLNVKHAIYFCTCYSSFNVLFLILRVLLLISHVLFRILHVLFLISHVLFLILHVLLLISHVLFPVSVLPVKVWSLTCCRLNLCPILPFTSERNKSPNRLTTSTS